MNFCAATILLKSSAQLIVYTVNDVMMCGTREKIKFDSGKNLILTFYFVTDSHTQALLCMCRCTQSIEIYTYTIALSSIINNRHLLSTRADSNDLLRLGEIEI